MKRYPLAAAPGWVETAHRRATIASQTQIPSQARVATVERVPAGVLDRRHVHADLVRSDQFQVYFRQGRMPEPPPSHVVGHR